MAAGDPHPDAIAAADDGQGTAADAWAGMQPSGQAVAGDGNQLLSQVSAGRDLTLGDSVAGDKIAGDKVDGDKVTGDKIEIVVADPQQAAVVARSLRWSWPQPLDFGPYRTFRREGFVGRSWLFEEVRAWAMAEGAAAGRPRAQLIEAEYGVGKSAFLAELVDTQAAGVPVAAQHFCQFDAIATLAPGRFVSSIAAQLAAALPAYRAAIEAEEAAGLRKLLEAPDNDPIGAFDQAVLAPLEAMAPPASPLLLVVDALDEALEHRPSSDKVPNVTIVSLLGQRAQRFPRWLRLLATARPLPAVQQPLRQAFSLHSLNAEEARNLADLESYAEARCQQPPLAAKLAAAGLNATEVAQRLRTLSGGKFLYTAFVLNDLATEALPLRDRADLEALPAGMDDFYLQAFERRFPSEQVYDQVRELLALHCVQRDPLSRRELAAILNWPEARLLSLQQQLHDLLRLRRNDPAYGPKEFLAGFNHPSLSRWLTATDEHSGYPRAGRFSIDPEAAEAAIHRWALAELEAQRAHTWPYLVRHLASHLSQAERPALLAGLLGQFAWLEARLRLAGINALLGDFALAAPTPWLGRLERALSQAAHVLGHEDGWQGQEQLASQLLARISVDTELDGLLTQSKEWLLSSGSAIPRTASLSCHDALIRTIQVGSPGTNVVALAVLADGRIASGSSENIIQLWNPSEGFCTATLKGHTSSITSLLVRNERFIVSGSIDATIRIWDLQSGECIRTLDNLGSAITCLALVNSGCLASGSVDGSISLWDLNTFTRTDYMKRHLDRVTSLAVLNDGILASGSYDKTILLWNIKNDRLDDSLPRRFHEDEHWITSLAVLGDGGLISGSSNGTICVWNTIKHTSPKKLFGHNGDVMDLLPLNDNSLASAGGYEILLWNLDNERCISSAEGHLDIIHSVRVLPNGQFVSCDSGNTIRLWNLPCVTKSRIPDRHIGIILFLKTYTETVLVSLSVDTTVRYWDISSCACISVVEYWQTHKNLYTQFELSSGNNSGCSQSLFSANSRASWNGGCFHSTNQGNWSEFPPLEIDVNHFISIICMSVVCLAEKTNLNSDARVIFVADALISSMIWIPHQRLLVLGDASGRMHWLEIAPLQYNDDSELRHQRRC
jgi:WD40 repeat protein